jgi:hypothetical protein
MLAQHHHAGGPAVDQRQQARHARIGLQVRVERGQPARLGVVEAQRGPFERRQLSAQFEPHQPRRRRLAAQRQHGHAARRFQEGDLEDRVGMLVASRVHVVEHQDRVLGQAGVQPAEELARERRDVAGQLRRQQGQRGTAVADLAGEQEEQRAGIDVALVEQVPDRPVRLFRQIAGRQRGLAGARRRRDPDGGVARAQPVEQGEQARPPERIVHQRTR